MFDLSDKIVLVVGGRGYLGRDFCAHLKGQKATVISADLEELSQAASKSQEDAGGDGAFIQKNVDVTDQKSVRLLVGDIIKEFGRIDVLVFSVTSKPEDFYSPFVECSLEGWQSVVKVELDGVFLVTQEVGRVMEKQKHGNIILMSSIYGVVGNDQRIYEGANLDSLYAAGVSTQKQIYSHSVYPVVKGALISLARYLAAYWGHLNIRVNCISPGGVKHEGENETFVKKYSEKVPLGRKAEVSEISGAVVYLASDESSYVTGQNVIIDGGWTAW
jgi:NAD(P)-dependent dehydrogenase (short-subunit alcohol dehydrogenase family)